MRDLSMRSILIPNFLAAKEFILEKNKNEENYHHLTNVCRIKKGEKINLFDGNGKIYNCVVAEIDKKKIQLLIDECSEAKRSYHIHLIFALLKREGMSLMLKQAVELGFESIFPVTTRFSQTERELVKEERIFHLVESALIQSNNPFYPKIHSLMPLMSVPWSMFDDVIYLTEKELKETAEILPRIGNHRKIALIIGPEAGLSLDEENELANHFSQLKSPIFHRIHLPCPILKAPTALSAGAGMIFSMLRDKN